MTMRNAAAALLALAALAAAGNARANERLAVVVLVDGEPATSDSLTEIAIAHLAETRGGLVGLRELRGRLPAAPDGRTLEACLAGGRCLAELGTAADAGRALVGTLTAAPDASWRLDLLLADTATGSVVKSTQRTLPRDPSPLADGLRAAIDELLPPPPPKVELAPPAPAPAPPSAVLVQPPGPPAVQPTSRATIAGLTLAGLAAASFVTAAVLGTIASSAPEGATRADAQADLRHRESEATVANGLFIASGALAVASAGVLIWAW
jgi:hypothetical protein